MIVSVADADTYFATRFGASTYWASGVDKDGALQTAENMLDVEYDLGSEDADAAVVEKAICEQALFLLRNPDWESRAALRAQGVTHAGIVEETYAAGGGQPICEFARKSLSSLARGTGSGSFAVER